MRVASGIAGVVFASLAAALIACRAIAADVAAVTYTLDFSTYLGGANAEYLRGMAVDGEGNAYVVGLTSSHDWPTTPGVFQTKFAGGTGDAYIAKFSAAGKLIWSTYVGTASSGDCLFSVRVDRAGFVYVAGRMGPGFPTTAGVFQPTSATDTGFVGKMKPDGSGFVWASYVGNGNSCRDMSMDDEGNIYLPLPFDTAGKNVLPETWFASAYQKTPHGDPQNHGHGHCDVGIIKISSDGSKVLWASYLGGSRGNDWVASVGVGADHCPVIFLNTFSTDMPTTADAFCKTPSKSWVGKLSADGSKLIFGTYTGVTTGTPFARTHNVAIDAKGNIFIAACTDNTWPVTNGAFQTKFGGGPEDFGVMKISPTGALLAATFLGGSGHEINGPDQIVVDGDGNVIVVGSSSSADYPVTPGAFQSHNGGAGGKYPYDGVVSVLSNDLTRLLYSTYMGGTGDEMARACSPGPAGSLYVGGVTTGKDFPTRHAFQAAYAGDPGFGSAPNGGSTPVGWGNGDCWLARFIPSR